MKKALILTAVFLILQALTADIPGETEQFVYIIQPFDGRGYDHPTFCTQNSDTIYLLANMENFIEPRKSLVYFWPLSGSWQLDTDSLYEIFDGYLQVKGDPIGTKTYSLTTYTWSRQENVYETRWKVFLDKDAETAYGQFTALRADYEKKLTTYQKELPVYEQYVKALDDEIGKQQEAGRDVSRLLVQKEDLKAPVRPTPPDYYVYPLRKAFVLNLPAGKYTVQFTSPEGLIMEKSGKNLVIFNKRRENGIGYEIVPGDKWTKPEKSFTPASVLYVDGTTDLFLKPFFEDEFNDLYYNKMLNNQGKGNHRLYRWQEIRQVPEARIEITDNTGTARIIREMSFSIIQEPGAAPGYSIVPYNQQQAGATAPDFKAFHIPVPAEIRYIKIRLQDKNSNYLKLSNREIRIIKKNRPAFILVIFAFLPLLVYLLIIFRRNKKLKAGGQSVLSRTP